MTFGDDKHIFLFLRLFFLPLCCSCICLLATQDSRYSRCNLYIVRKGKTQLQRQQQQQQQEINVKHSRS